MYFLHRPDEAVFNREEEEHPDSRELSDEPWRRQVISNLAKHILFSKSAQKACSLPAFLKAFSLEIKWLTAFRGY